MTPTRDLILSLFPPDQQRNKSLRTTFVLNLSVSFYLALKLALKAHGANLGGNITIARTIFEAFLHSPRDFFFPPLDDSGRTRRSRQRSAQTPLFRISIAR